MPLTSDRGRLLDLLKNHSLLFGDFTLVSGKKSRFYFDSKRTTLLPEGTPFVINMPSLSL